jgi:hypothetical protein
VKSDLRLAVALIAAGLAGCQGQDITAETAADLPSGEAAAVSGADLHAVYADKTWDWGDGAGFFSKEGDFRAWTEAGGTAAYATGFWWVNEPGRLCFDGTWRTKEGANSAITCFDHRTDGKVWYQKRDPSGSWYVFKSDPVKPSDESAKLRPGDQVEAGVEMVKKQLGAGTP